jgi:hypothetical protein
VAVRGSRAARNFMKELCNEYEQNIDGRRRYRDRRRNGTKRRLSIATLQASRL